LSMLWKEKCSLLFKGCPKRFMRQFGLIRLYLTIDIAFFLELWFDTSTRKKIFRETI
jgi:hypothetical protein